MAQLNYAYSSSLQLGVGAKVIGEDEDEESYWSSFSNNDQFYMSAAYTF
jgi:hypothetical protein